MPAPPSTSPSLRTPTAVTLVVLLLVVAMHVVLRAGHDLSPWKGGGFAMFSTVDSPGSRTIAVWADVGGVDERVDLGDRWDDARQALRSLPTQDRVQDLAASVASTTLVRSAGGTLVPAATDDAPPTLAPRGAAPAPVATLAPVEARSIRVEVLRLTYDDGVVRTDVLRTAAVER